jgi:hypothetical protein
MTGPNRRQAILLGSAAVAYGLAPSNVARAIEIDSGHEWAKIAARQFMQLGVTLARNDDDNPAGVRVGDKLDNKHMLIQRHVDWVDSIVDGAPRMTDIRIIEPALGALTGSVARSIGPSKQLKTYSLFVPKGAIYNCAHLRYGHLRLRFLQSYYPGDQGGDEGIISRIDILFPHRGT